MIVASPSQGYPCVAEAIERPKQTRTYVASDGLFICAFGPYAWGVNERTRSTLRKDVTTTESTNPVQMRYRIDV